jgi:hypothetical protein
MRYLYVSKSKERTSTFGAVGHICYFTSAYLFFFEIAFVLGIPSFIHTILAIEIAIMLLTAGMYKIILGYNGSSGLEFALVNPTWSRFAFFFKKLNPSNFIFKTSNFLGPVSELLCGLLFLFPQSHTFAALFLIAIFSYVFLLLRVSILAPLMISSALLYLPPIDFHFPVFTNQLSMSPSEALIVIIQTAFIIYIVCLIATTLYTLYNKPIPKILQCFSRYRPFFIWSVFTAAVTHFFVKIEKNSSLDGKAIHHHDASLLLEIVKAADSDKLIRYAKSIQAQSHSEIVFTLMHIMKTEDSFLYLPRCSITVDVDNGMLTDCKSYTVDGVAYSVDS